MDLIVRCTYLCKLLFISVFSLLYCMNYSLLRTKIGWTFVIKTPPPWPVFWIHFIVKHFFAGQDVQARGWFEPAGWVYCWIWQSKHSIREAVSIKEIYRGTLKNVTLLLISHFTTLKNMKFMALIWLQEACLATSP